ncbi:MAG: hypothetical protein D6766_10985 [Verrucomicrobia bacterium]|nr:MAG: hypothetical protein D6766_10985 [Verrucomicrobiota bacterium]
MEWIEAVARPGGWLERHWVARHRARCPECAARAAAERAVEARLRGERLSDPPAPPFLVRRIQAAVAAESRAVADRAPAMAGRWQWAVAVAGLVWALWLGWRFSAARATPETAVAFARQQAELLVRGVTAVSPERAFELAGRAEAPLEAELQAILEDARQTASQVVRGCVPVDSIRLAGFWPAGSGQQPDAVEARTGGNW